MAIPLLCTQFPTRPSSYPWVCPWSPSPALAPGQKCTTSEKVPLEAVPFPTLALPGRITPHPYESCLWGRDPMIITCRWPCDTEAWARRASAVQNPHTVQCGPVSSQASMVYSMYSLTAARARLAILDCDCDCRRWQLSLSTDRTCVPASVAPRPACARIRAGEQCSAGEKSDFGRTTRYCFVYLVQQLLLRATYSGIWGCWTCCVTKKNKNFAPAAHSLVQLAPKHRVCHRSQGLMNPGAYRCPRPHTRKRREPPVAFGAVCIANVGTLPRRGGDRERRWTRRRGRAGPRAAKSY